MRNVCRKSVPRKDEVGNEEQDCTNRSHIRKEFSAALDGESPHNARPNSSSKEQSINAATYLDGKFANLRNYFRCGKNERNQAE